MILGSRPSSIETLASFDKPTLIVGSSNDLPCPPEHQQDMAQLNQQAELHILPDVGHFAPIEKPNQIKQLIEQWVSKHYE